MCVTALVCDEGSVTRPAICVRLDNSCEAVATSARGSSTRSKPRWIASASGPSNGRTFSSVSTKKR